MGLTRIRAEQISNIDYKQAVRAVSTTNVNLSGGAPVEVDGVTLVQGNRVLVTGQENAAQNGIYVVQTLGTGENGTWIRSADGNQNGEIEPGMVIMVTEGTAYADTPWKLITNGTIIIGTTPLTFQQFTNGAGSSTTVGNTAPSSPSQGDVWINSDTGSQYIYFTSGGNSQWAEMEADQSFSFVSGSEVDLTAVSSDILPTANLTYDIGNVTNRFRDIYLANSTIYLGEAQISATDGAVVLPANTTVGGAVVSAVPKVTGFVYPGDDTAADPAGGQTILINGANFESGCVVYLDNAVMSPVVFVSSTQLSFTSPAKVTGTYSVYVVNPDGSTALALPGIIYSGVPLWSTAAGSIGTPYETDSFAAILSATADSPVTYAVAPGNTLPSDLTLNSSTGNLSGNIPVTNNDTTYTFSVRATDGENQDTDRQFSVTYKTDVVAWNSPADGSAYTWPDNVANSVPMSATSAAGKAVSFAVQSGTLPANVTIAGNLITGTPTTVQSNTAVVVRATAAITNRYADQTFYFTIVPGIIPRGVWAGGSPGPTNTIDYVTITTLGNATDFGDLTVARDKLAGCSSTTRGVFGAGESSSGFSNRIDYITIATTGNATYFGDLTKARYSIAACSDSTRGLFAGGMDNTYQSINIIDYVTIASTGNAIDYGDLYLPVQLSAGCSSPTRGLIGGGLNVSNVAQNVIQYVTIASTGNSLDFGDLVEARYGVAACSSSTRGVFAGGYNGGAKISYVTIASLGNAIYFGDLTVGRHQFAGCSSTTRGLFGGGLLSNGNTTNIIDYITIETTGNATDFGDLSAARGSPGACSNNHGGLQ